MSSRKSVSLARRVVGRRLPRARASLDIRFACEAAARERARIRHSLERAIRKAVELVVAIRRRVAVDVLMVDEKEIRRLNSEHRGIRRATDALSFPQLTAREVRPVWGVFPPACYVGANEEVKDRGSFPALPAKGAGSEVHLGDIVLCLPMIERQAQRRDTTLHEELQFVAVHSFLHLMGCDHDTAARRRAMWDFTQTLLGDEATR